MSTPAEQLAHLQEDPPASEPAEQAPRHEIVRCGRFEIFPDKTLPLFDAPGAPAFMAEDGKNPRRPLFARVAEYGLYPRSDSILRIKAMRDVPLMLPLHWGAVRWPGEPGGRMVSIFDRPPAGPLMPSLDERIEPLSPEELCQTLLAPALRTLMQFQQRGLAHRAIRPNNIFPPSEDRKPLLLGECISTPMAWGQPASMEPIPLMMCDREARGSGWVADDLYALGATLLILSLGHDPARGVDDDALLKTKIEHGSYVALLQGERSPRGLREPLRGLLADDVRQRWDLEDLERWLSGTLRRSTQPTPEYKSDRSFAFAGKEYQSCRPLAHALGKNWDDAAEAVKSVAFDSWIKRGIGDAALSDTIDGIIAVAAHTKSPAVDDALMVSRTCMMLDRDGPLRFKGLTFMPEAVGAALAQALIRSDGATAEKITECLESDLPQEWHALQLKAGLGAGDIDGRAFSRLNILLRQKGPGYGVERCVYELDRNVPCLSDILEGRPVVELPELLETLDDIVKNKGRLTALIDRHLAAFIAARMRKNLDPHLSDIASATGDSPTAKLGMVRLLALAQESSGPGKLVHLTRWIADDLRELATGFRSRTYREKVAQQLEKVAESGILGRVYELLGNERIKRQDEQGYAMAMRKYAHVAEQIGHLQSQEYEDEATNLGFSIATTVSGLTAAAAAVFVLLF